jgi:Ca2+-binding RTX toxin-like protein
VRGRTIIAIAIVTAAVLTPPTDAAKLTGTGTSDIIFGGRRVDTIRGGEFFDILFGKGNKRKRSTPRRKREFLDGGSHADSIFPGAGRDVALGGTGVDSLHDGDGTPGDRIDGQGDGATLWAADGASDQLDCGGTGSAIADISDVVTGCDFVVTTSVVDEFFVGQIRDIVIDEVGLNTFTDVDNDIDVVFGLGGNDTINLGGSVQPDRANGGSGVDAIAGGAGDDFLTDDDGTGGDVLHGGLGADIFWTADGASTTVNCGAGDGALDQVYADTIDTITDCGNDVVVVGDARVTQSPF